MITPDIIENKDFAKSIRGYSCVEVDEFLDEIIDDLKTLLDENRQMKLELSTLRQAVDSYKTPSDSVVDTLESAKKLMKDISESAERRAEIIIKNAYLDAENIKKEAREAVQQWAKDTEGFRKGASDFIQEYKDALESEKGAIDKKIEELSQMDQRLSAALYKMPETSFDNGFTIDFISERADKGQEEEKHYTSAEEILQDYSLEERSQENAHSEAVNYRMQDTLLWDGPGSEVKISRQDDKAVEDLLKSQALDIKIQVPVEDTTDNQVQEQVDETLNLNELAGNDKQPFSRTYAPKETVALDSEQLRDLLKENR